MQTFLPYPDFSKSSACLDNKRLGKQRVECLQILKTLVKGEFSCGICGDSWENCCCMPMQCSQKQIKTPWYDHPAVKMWRGHEKILASYGLKICQTWIDRGFKDTCYDKIFNWYNPNNDVMNYLGIRPNFIGNEAFHASHRSNLLRKDPIHYGQFGWTEPNNLPYVWPV